MPVAWSTTHSEPVAQQAPPATQAFGQQAPPAHTLPAAQVPVGWVASQGVTGAVHVPAEHTSDGAQQFAPHAEDAGQHAPPTQLSVAPQHCHRHADPSAQHDPSTHVCPEGQAPRGFVGLHAADGVTHVRPSHR